MSYQPPTKTPQQITSTQLAQLKTKVRLPEKDIIAMALADLWLKYFGK